MDLPVVCCSYLLFWLFVGLRQDEVDVDAEVVLGQQLVLVVPLQARRSVVDEPLALNCGGDYIFSKFPLGILYTI